MTRGEKLGRDHAAFRVIPTMTERVAEILYTTGDISEEDAYLASNQLLYMMNVYGMTERDLPYLLALYYQESRFNPLAANPRSSARGFGQILMSLHRGKFERADWRDVEQNIYVSFLILEGPYTRNAGVENLYTRWYNILRCYCGTAQNARNALRHVSTFEELL